MDLSFSIQALTVKHLNENRGKLPIEVIDVPRNIDDRVANLKLKAMGLRIEKLTPKQKKYLTSWQDGTI
jgi:adenosylhomocysteinase